MPADVMTPVEHRGKWFGGIDDAIPRPSAVVPTPLGDATVTVWPDYMVAFDLGRVTIFRVSYAVYGEFRLDPRTEEWRFFCKSVGVSDGYVTKAARKKIEAALMPVMQAWVDANADKVTQGDRINDERLILRAKARIDDIEAELEARRAELRAVEEDLKRDGRITDASRRSLEDVYNYRWHVLTIKR